MFTLTDGFDVVIGNPPYVQLQKFKGNPLQNAYKEQLYTTYDANGDLYCLFYEKGINLLRNNGVLAFITSNKWMRAGYGEKLRKYVSTYNPLVLVDLGPGVFDAATVDTNILLVSKEKNKKHLLAATLSGSKGDKFDLGAYMHNHGITLSNIGKDAWFIGNQAELNLKAKIDRIGKPLKDWDVKINYGIKTGLNEAFIIDTETRNRLVAEDPKSADIMKPILRGRDIQRYTPEWAGLWLIASGFDIDIPKQYQAVFSHLLQFEEKAKKRDDQGKNWWNLRSCAYYPEFEKEKIIYPNMTKYLPFAYDTKAFYTNDKCFCITGSNLKYLTGVLNSKIAGKWIKENCPELQGGTRELRKIFLEKIKIPPITSSNRPVIEKIESVASVLLLLKQENKKIDMQEREIDQLVYQLYDLTPEERAIIEKQP